ncbi:FG-GAP-like repeat-containing protein [Chloroflexota bacterium]
MNTLSSIRSLLTSSALGLGLILISYWALNPNSSAYAANITVNDITDDIVDSTLAPIGSNRLIQTSQITSNTIPIADFYVDSTFGQIPFTVTFTNTSQFADSYLWSYGDGITSTISAFTHTHVYTAPGYYFITLIGYNAYGSDSWDDYIYVTDLPLVYFDGEPRHGLITMTTTFTNHSLFADSYLWDYGDGLTSNTNQITHTHLYTTPGFYTVTLTAINIYGVVSYTEQSYIGLYDIPTPSFDAQPLTGAIPLTVTFSNSSTWATNYYWDFGDGTQSTASQPTHIYNTAGQYTVTLTASNPMTSRVISKISYIQPYDFRVISSDPQNAKIGINTTKTISVTFNRVVDANSINIQNFTVWGEQTGIYEGTYTTTENVVQYESLHPFKPGEKILVNLNNHILSYDGLRLIPHTWQFQTDVGVGNGNGSIFSDSGQTVGNSTTLAVALGDLDGDGDLDAFIGNGGWELADEIWLNDGAGQFSDSGQRIGRSDTRSVALGDLDGDGDLDAFTAYWGSGPSRRNKVWFNDGTGMFSDSGQNLGSVPSSGVALGDLDGDGDLDAFVGNDYDSGDTIWLNDGTGHFDSSGQSLGSYTRGVALGDVDNDGDLDVFTISNGVDGNKVWLNNGNGYFNDSGQNLNDNTWSSFCVALGDLDGDDDLDAFVGVSGLDGENTVWLNNGLGTFIDSGQRLGNSVSYGVNLGDFDGDGDVDAFVANADNQPNKIWLNDGIANFYESSQNLGTSDSYVVALGDLDHDSDIDALVANYNFSTGEANKVWFNQNTSILGLGAHNNSPTNLGYLTTLTATVIGGNNVTYDWDLGDSTVASGATVLHSYPSAGTYTAVVTASNSTIVLTATTTVTIWYPLTVTITNPPGNGDMIASNGIISATFNRTINTNTVTAQAVNVWGKHTGVYTQNYAVFSNSISFDSHLDYKPGEEIVVGLNDNIKATDGVPLIPFMWQFRAGVAESTGIFYDSGQNLGGLDSNDVALGDLDGDGDLDAFVVNGGLTDWEPNEVWLNNGGIQGGMQGDFIDSGQSLGRSVSSGVALGDVDGDGDLDAFVANSYDDRSNKVWLNDGVGNFTDSGQSLGNGSSYDVALGDFDSDGDLDAFVVNGSTSATLSANKIWLNNGVGVFSDSGQLLVGQRSNAVALGDLDSDGDLDAFVANRSPYQDKIWLNDGTGVFSDSGQELDYLSAKDVALGDVDDDGDLDAFIAVLGVSDQRANKIWLNDGTGMFNDSGQRLGSSASYGVGMGDIDGDGDLDAFVGNYAVSISEPPNKVWLNDGTGIFSDSNLNLGDSNSNSIVLGDIDGDYDLDAFIGNFANANKVWFNQNYPIVGLSASNDSPTTWGNLTTLTASVAGGNGVTYAWGFGDGILDEGTIVSHRYPEVRTYTAIVTASNSTNLLTATTIVTINNIPSSAIPIFGRTITPTEGVTITADGGVFSETVLIIYTPHSITSTGTLSNIGVFYELSAQYLLNGLPAQPQSGHYYTITITYHQEDIPDNINESDLALYYWNGDIWIEEPTSIVDSDANTVTARPSHFSLWAILARDTLQGVYLPIIFKP